MKIVKMYLPQSKYALKSPYTMDAKKVATHNTANDAPARNEASYMIGNNSSTSFHAVIEDKEVVECIPINRNAFHAGGGRNGEGNRKAYSIEICYSKSGGERFEAAEDNAAAYTAMILKEKRLGD